MEKKTVLVTGIGGNVGQGIIRNIKATGYFIRIIGSNVTDMSAGNHLVETFYKVSYSYEEKYLAEIIELVDREKIDLIIPTTDYEIYYLSVNKDKIPCKIACSGHMSSSIYLDKYLTFIFHKKNEIPFAETCLPSEFNGNFNPAIAKPRKGRGSSGLLKYLKTSEGLLDEEYLVQKMYHGIEITTSAYVSYYTAKLVGFITMERSLENGATTFCRVVKHHDDELEKLLLKIIECSDIKGSFNLQSMVTTDQQIFPFEGNCRISGTNSIRSHFGFNDVRFMLDELLYNTQPGPITISDGVAYRYLADVIYPEGIKNGDNSDNFILF